MFLEKTLDRTNAVGKSNILNPKIIFTFKDGNIQFNIPNTTHPTWDPPGPTLVRSLNKVLLNWFLFGSLRQRHLRTVNDGGHTRSLTVVPVGDPQAIFMSRSSGWGLGDTVFYVNCSRSRLNVCNCKLLTTRSVRPLRVSVWLYL